MLQGRIDAVTPAVEGNLQVAGSEPGMHVPETKVPNKRATCSSGGVAPPGLNNPSQDLLRVSLIRVG